MSSNNAWLFFVLLQGIGLDLSAQDCLMALRGRVFESDQAEPLAYATIYIKEAQKGTTTDENGNFSIVGLCEGTSYTVAVSHIECNHSTQIVRLTENTLMDFRLSHNDLLQEVIVVEKAIVLTAVQSEVSVEKLELEAGKGLNLSETLKRLPGVTTLNTGANIAKPVIQGLHSNRIAIVNNGVTLEGQQWGSEHAPEIDPFSAEKISVVKGAAGVRYGAGAMGGAVLLEPAPLRSKAGVGAWLALGGFSNGFGGVTSGAIDWAPSSVHRRPSTVHRPPSLAIRLQGTLKKSGNLRTPDYWLGNTGLEERNFSAIVQWKRDKWRHELSTSRFDQKIAVLRAAHFPDAAEVGRLPFYNNDKFTYKIGRPYQRVQHQAVKYKSEFRLSEDWKTTAQYSFQYNKRREYDADTPLSDPLDLQNKAQISFRLWTNMLDLALEHLPIRHWQGGVGVQGMHQLNYVGKGGSIPDYNTFGASVWLLERWRRFPHPWEWEAGLRYDYRQTSVATFGSLENLDTLVHYGNASGTIGAIYHFTPKLKATLNTAFAWRPPHVNELFARGSNHGSAIYERGRADLIPEKAWNTNFTLDWKSNRAAATFTFYRNNIRDFIYLNPTGKTVVTVRSGPDGQPLYEYQQADAILQGLDGSISLPLVGDFSLESRVSLLRGFRFLKDTLDINDKNIHEWLPLMPPDRFQYGLKWSLSNNKTEAKGETYLRLMAMMALQQKRIAADQLPILGQPYLQLPPPTFTVLMLDAAHTIHWGTRLMEIGLSVQNITNARYREYLNFFRNYVDEIGVNVGLRAKFIF
jgi:iron complex outermembrane recepter protein